MPLNPQIANEFTAQEDLVNLGLKCRSCGSKKVVYTITVIDSDFPLGSYCYNCLLNLCKASKRKKIYSTQDEYKIPMPMAWNLFARLKVELGLEKASQNPAF